MLSALFPSEGRLSNAIVSTSVWGQWPGEQSPTTNVDETSAMQLMAVYGSVNLISSQISTLPVDVFRKTGENRVEIAAPDWLMQPTPDLDLTTWVGQVLWSLLLEGNAYIRVMRSGGRVVSLEPLDPTAVTPEKSGGRTRFRVNGELIGGQVIHIKGLMRPGSLKGLSPVEYARQTIGLGLAAQDYGKEFFEGEGNMPGVIETPGPMQPETQVELAKQWQRKRRKGGRGLPGVLQGGAQWKPTAINHEQAQFLKTRQYSAAEIAGQLYLVDPSDLGIPVEGTSLTYANLQDRNTRRVQVTLLPWIIRLEKALSGLMQQTKYVKFNVEGLLRGDQKTRFETYAIGISSGILLPNEAREIEDMEPISERPSAS